MLNGKTFKQDVNKKLQLQKTCSLNSKHKPSYWVCSEDVSRVGFHLTVHFTFVDTFHWLFYDIGFVTSFLIGCCKYQN